MYSASVLPCYPPQLVGRTELQSTAIPDLFTKSSTNSYQRFSHSDAALLFSSVPRVEN